MGDHSLGTDRSTAIKYLCVHSFDREKQQPKMKKQKDILTFCPCTSAVAEPTNADAISSSGTDRHRRIQTRNVRSLINIHCRRKTAISPSIGCWLALLLPLSSLALLFNDQMDEQSPIFYSAKKKLKEQEIIQKVLRDYDWRVRPRGKNDSWQDTGGPVLVSVNIYLRSISKIDDVNMEYSAQFTFREEWWDPRLAYGRFADDQTEVPAFVVLATSEQADLTQQIWMPDTFFQNEKEARRHLIDKPNVLIRIHPDGQILYSVRLSLVLSCPMSLEYYPLDRQTCLIDLASYAYTTDDIKYEWKKEKPIQQKEGLRQSLPSFELQDVLTDYCTSKTNTGEYSCVRVKLFLRREYSYYLIQLYIPCVMLVVVSWVSFWLDKDAVPARVSLGVTTLLTMTTQSSGINSKLPPVSYIKAVDVWIGACLAFIFAALLEYALVNYYGRREFMHTEKRGKMGIGRLSMTFQQECLCPPPPNIYHPDFFSPKSPTKSQQQLLSVPGNNTNNNIVGFVSPSGGGGAEDGNHPPLSLENNTLFAGRGGCSSSKRRRRVRHFAICASMRRLRQLLGSGVDLSKRVDIVSRVAFPTLYLAFLCFYYVRFVLFQSEEWGTVGGTKL